MKLISFLFLSLIAYSSCTTYDEELLTNDNYETLTPDSLITQLPIVHLRVNQTDFDSIHENFNEEQEILSFVSFLRNGEIVENNIKSDIKIKGSSSTQFPLKSLGIIFDKSQDNSGGTILLPNNKLDRHNLDELKTIRLRNSGNDFLKTMIKQLCYIQLAIEANLNIELNYIEPSVVFVNNNFHGIMNINSEVNANGISKLSNIPKEDLTLIKVNASDYIVLKNGDKQEFDTFLNKIKEKDLDYFLENIDIDNTIDYMIFETMMAHGDWSHNNVRFYKTPTTKWRFALFDLDHFNDNRLHKASLDYLDSDNGNRMSQLFLLLIEDQDFKKKYDSRYSQLVLSKQFIPDNFNRIVDQNTLAIEKIMPFHIQKYGTPKTMTEWYLNVEQLKSNYLKRYRFLTNHLN